MVKKKDKPSKKDTERLLQLLKQLQEGEPIITEEEAEAMLKHSDDLRHKGWEK